MPMPQRFRSAGVGFGITMAPIAVIACLQFLFAPYTVALVYTDPDYVAWAVPSLRGILVNVHAVVALIIAAYWLFVAILGGGQFLRIKSANIVLALSCLTFALAMAVMSMVPIPAQHGLFKTLCPILGHSDEVLGVDGVTTFCFDCLSPCDVFAGDAATIVFLGAPVILLIASAILRLIVSRRRDRDGPQTSQPASPSAR